MPVTIVIPVLNDADALAALLSCLKGVGDPALQIVVADGGSADGSQGVAREAGCRLVESSPGRGRQLAAGIAATAGDWVWMLHADTLPSAEALAHVRALPGSPPGWGRFAVSLAPGAPLELVAVAMNLRSRLTGICTGDQGIFVHQSLLDRVGGQPRQSLMEDVELSRRLKRVCRPDCRAETIAASPRRWRHRGVVRTVLSMWWFRLRYRLGADPERLAREYYPP